jgi:aconitate hydratase
MSHNTLKTLKEFKISGTKKGKFYSLPALKKSTGIDIDRLPVSIRIVLESVLRNCDGKKVTEAHVRQLAGWKPNAARTDEIPFVVARVVVVVVVAAADFTTTCTTTTTATTTTTTTTTTKQF